MRGGHVLACSYMYYMITVYVCACVVSPTRRFIGQRSVNVNRLKGIGGKYAKGETNNVCMWIIKNFFFLFISLSKGIMYFLCRPYVRFRILHEHRRKYQN